MKTIYLISILLIEIVVSRLYTFEIFGTNWYGLNFSYMVFLMVFVILGTININRLDAWEKIVLYYLAFVFVSEVISLQYLLNVPKGAYKMTTTFIYFLFYYYLFNSKLKIGKMKKGVKFLSVLFLIAFCSRLFFNEDLNVRPVVTICFFIFYVIIISFLGLLSLIDTPSKQALHRNSFFLFLLATLVMYSVHFWTVSLGHFINKLEMETIIKYRFLLFDISRIIMVMSYAFISLMFLKSRKKLNPSI